MMATADDFACSHPGVKIVWNKRSLQAFADHPIRDLASQYDLIVMDHPHVGVASAEGSLVSLNRQGHDDELGRIAGQSLGRSHESYAYDGQQWALAIDAAALVAAYRPDLIDKPPATWPEVMELAKAGRVLWPIKPVDAISSYFTVAANLGYPCGIEPSCLIDDEVGRQVLEIMRLLAVHVPTQCLAMNPIQIYEWMVEGDQYVYCPLLYGYNNYARAGYRRRLLKFSNIPVAGDDGPCGSNLGGTGIAVSSSCRYREVAVEYAFWIAGEACQRGLYFESGGQPGNAAAWADPSINSIASNFFIDTRETMDRSYLRPRYNGYMAFQDRGGDIVNACLAGSVGIRDAQRQLKNAYQESRNS